MLDATPTVSTRADGLKDRAKFFVSKRRKDVELYALLADCLSLCEEIDGTAEVESLKSAVISRADGRSYFEKTADVFLVVGRYVFEGKKARAACWRYTSVMREAHSVGVAGAHLKEYLKTEGGINALFKSRKVKARTAKTKTINLNQAVEVPKSGEFTITLRRDHRGFFDVISQ